MGFFWNSRCNKEFLKQLRITDYAEVRLNMSMNTGASWTAQALKSSPKMFSRPATFLVFTLLGFLSLCSEIMKA